MIEQPYVYFSKMLPKRWMIENCYLLFHIILGSPDTYLNDRHHKYVLSMYDLQEVILMYDQWYLCVIYLHHPYPGAHVKIYIVFRCDTLYLVGKLFNVQLIQSNTMPSWHNWTNIFDTEIFWPFCIM